MKNIIEKLSKISLLQLCFLLANGMWIAIFGNLLSGVFLWRYCGKYKVGRG